MANASSMEIRAVGLWSHPWFWQLLDKSREEVERDFTRSRGSAVRIHGESLRSLLNELCDRENLLQHGWKPAFLDGDMPYQVAALLYQTAEDTISVCSSYSPDFTLLHAFAEIIPETEVSGKWFTDGIGDYGVRVIKNHVVTADNCGNIFDAGK